MRLLINHQATAAMIITAAAILAIKNQLMGGGGGTGVGGVGGGGGGALTLKEPVTPLTSTLWTPVVSLVVVKMESRSGCQCL